MVDDEQSPFRSHSQWFMQRACFPFHDREPDEIEKYCAAKEAEHADPVSPRWECMGPFDVAGRTTSLVAHPDKPEVVFAGSANGGLWRSMDGGGNWEPKWKRWGAASIGAAAFDPADRNTLYVATGEANGTPDAYPGSGVFRSADLGETWTSVAGAGKGRLPRRIGALAADPMNKGVWWVGGASHQEGQSGGLYYLHADTGQVQRENFFSRNSYRCHSIVFHPDGFALVAVDCGGLQSGIWRKRDGEWTQMGDGLPSGDRVGRISLAIAAQAPHAVWALVANRAGNGLLGVYRSVGGEVWRKLRVDSELAQDDTLSYNNCIAVHPRDARTVACGGRDLHITRDEGATWTRATHWDAEPGDPLHVHADHHAILMPGGDAIYSANDGGVAFSGKMGAAWEPRVKGLCTTMFYDIDVSPVNHMLFGGGAQDNGCLLAGPKEANGGYLRLQGGDGSGMVFDPKRVTRAYSARSDVHLARHKASPRWSEEFWEEASPRGIQDFDRRKGLNTIVTLDPADPDTVWTGTRRLWRSLDGGEHWRSKSGVLDGSAITAIEVAGRNVFAGTARGGFFRSEDGGETFTGDISGPEIPARFISRIETHPATSGLVVVTVAGNSLFDNTPQSQGPPSPYLSVTEEAPDPSETMYHVFLSVDNGATWRAIDLAGVPKVACHAAVFRRNRPFTLYIANDCGVWASDDFEKWMDVTGNMPNVLVSDLVYHDATRMLWASTYGRGIWRLPLLA